MMERREFIRVSTCAVVAGCTGVFNGCRTKGGVPVRFAQGVASGDPTEQSVLIWTRAEPAHKRDVPVEFEMALDPYFKKIVASGVTMAESAYDFTIRIKITSLEPSTYYYYRFKSFGHTSDVGRTKTAPLPDTDVPVKFASAYGQAFVGRYFNSWRHLCRTCRDIDFVLFLGDYIYEFDWIPDAQLPYGARSVTLPDGLVVGKDRYNGMVANTLRDYRVLYRTWRSDPDLKLAHRMFPFVTMWDDHEFANDCWQDHANDFNGAKGDEKETQRREAATRAFYEYIPVDVEYAPEKGFPEDIRLYRSFRYGANLELFLTDQRYYRDDHVIPEGPIDLDVGKLQKNSAIGSRVFVLKQGFDNKEAEKRPTMLGSHQLEWLESGMVESNAQWKVLASPTIVSQMLLDLRDVTGVPSFLRKVFYFKLDQWDGYRTERARLLRNLAGVENMVVLTGDIHATLVSKVYEDFDSPGVEPVGIEYIGPSISSSSIREQLELAVRIDETLKKMELGGVIEKVDDVLMHSNPHYKYVECESYGYAIVEVNPGVDFRVSMVQISDVKSPEPAPAAVVKRFRTPIGRRAVEIIQ